MSAAVRSGGDIELAAGVLDASPDHRQAHMAGPDGAVGLGSVDPDAVVADLEHELACLLADVDLDPGGIRVLDGVDDELAGYPNAVAAGMTTRERVPPSGRVAISSRPPASSTRRRTIASPTWPA